MWVCLPLSPRTLDVFIDRSCRHRVLWSATGVGLTNRKALVDTHAYLFLATLWDAHYNFVLRLTGRDGTLKHVHPSWSGIPSQFAASQRNKFNGSWKALFVGCEWGMPIECFPPQNWWITDDFVVKKAPSSKYSNSVVGHCTENTALNPI